MGKIINLMDYNKNKINDLTIEIKANSSQLHEDSETACFYVEDYIIKGIINDLKKENIQDTNERNFSFEVKEISEEDEFFQFDIELSLIIHYKTNKILNISKMKEIITNIFYNNQMDVTDIIIE